ncbi:NAD-dependent epimerase/dehydratase family protein [Paraburkholderia diazotrophica]|uniref:UDP-glucose 4-epimerase n=1 Tax=Paraburkholderia diazotrophica TaxID=667676 RepID=A0A1H7DLC2_9BURK|nr:NAD-dependent epimerase/dehydratase family protein [Paraburkholderia diazotrophica]SEK02154.1 UDP-glucose 4-epimerase [Paraburkholderia diazotrophica]
MNDFTAADVDGKRVLVLGGKGFLGTHLVDAFVRCDIPVRVFDRRARQSLDPALVDVVDSQNDVARTSNIEVVTGDFASGEGLADALDGVDLVYHLISTTVPSTSNANPIADVQGNLIGTLRLLEMMRDAGIRRIVYVSSGGTVYGNPSILPVPETHPLQPLCSYGVVKVAVENYLHMHAELYGLTSNVLRVANPYGTHQHHIGVQGIIPTFFKKIADGSLIEIWGDGSVVRDYIHVNDVVSALLRAGARDRSGTFNIGSGIGHSVNEILEIVQRYVGQQADVRYLPQRNFDVAQIYLDISKAQRELDWQPLLSLDAGCALYWQTIKQPARPRNAAGYMEPPQ